MRTDPVVSPMPWVLGVLGGTALHLQQAQLWPLALYTLMLVLSLAAAWMACLHRCHPIRFSVIAMMCGALLSFSQSGWRAQVFIAQAMPADLEGRDIELVGRVQGLPQFAPQALRFGLRVEQAQVDGRAVALPPEIALSWYMSRIVQPELDSIEKADATDGQIYREALAEQARRQPQPVVPGERWQMTVRLKAPHGHINPHGHDHELRLWEQGVGALGYVRTAARHAAPVRLHAPRGAWIDRARLATRSAIYQAIDSSTSAGVIAALVMGDQQAIERADWDLFRATGVAHLMSISGLHITLFAWLATAAVGVFWRRSALVSPTLCLAVPAHVAGACGGLLLATTYALFSGWAVPAQRTIFMLAVVVALRLLARPWPWPVAWLLVMSAVLLMDPWALMQAGFWLSFAAVGILFASDSSGQQQQDRLSPGRSWIQRSLGIAARFVREQWVMTLALAPLSLLLFQQVSVVGLLANMVAIPWVTLLVTPLGLLGTVIPPLWEVAAGAMLILTKLLAPLAHAPWAVLERPAAPWWCAAGGLLGGLLLVMRWPWSVRVLGFALMLPVVLWQAPRPASGHFEVLALDVGQGSAVLVRTANYSLLYDAGPRYSKESDAGHRVLVPLLRALGLKLDLMVLSHGDSDHTGGAAAVLARQPDLTVFGSLPLDPGLKADRNSHQACRSGQRWQRDGVDFQILHPSEAFSASTRKSNALSCVLMISAPGGRALLTGDLEAAQERQLVAQWGPFLRADWLLAPHHGSRTSSSAEFLDAVKPQWVVVQAGYRNRFGHPAGSVVERYQQRKIHLVSTVWCGAAIWSSERPAQLDCQRERSARYWHHRQTPAR